MRFPADVPSVGRRVVLCLRVRRFACPVASPARSLRAGDGRSLSRCRD
ncbi:hypothetical protein OG840_33950 [Streptomyces sp. NBC_01764]|nr:hypothetical protein [Streptomyces sp. NBC_01764]MCX4406459.1 hypothetical protein [Streptomyces sp. NBC_01764]